MKCEERKKVSISDKSSTSSEREFVPPYVTHICLFQLDASLTMNARMTRSA